MTLRELVAAWRAQTVKVNEAFDAALAGINRELDAVGGFATTTPEWKPNGKGYCRDYWRQTDTFGCGVSVVGEKTGPQDRYTAPHFPEVGDRCFAMEQEHRKEAMALTESMLAIRRVAMPGAKDSTDETLVMACALAAKLVDDESSERETASEWVHKNAIEHLEAEKRLRPTDPQRADYSRVAYDALLYSAKGIHRGEHLR